ncbi:MAG: hypothetical protein AAFW82_03445 [Pseudomonadota bacterium]
MIDKIDVLEKRIIQLEARNQRVDDDKAWEVSFTRRFLILLITYVTACTVLYIIGVPDWYLGAMVPVFGFWLSTLSLSFAKSGWLRLNHKVK